MNLKEYVDKMIANVNQDMMTAFPGIDVGSGAYIETDQENIDGCLHEDASKLRPGDICLAYDWTSDELNESQVRIFYCIHDNFFSFIRGSMYVISDQDGSGNGLYYGLMALRAKTPVTIK